MLTLPHKSLVKFSVDAKISLRPYTGDWWRPLRQIRTVRNISGNRLFLWLFPSRRGAQGGWGWGLCKEWGKTVFLLCACLWYMCVRFASFCLSKFNLSNNCWRSQKKTPTKMTLTWNLFFQPLDYERNGTLKVKYQIHLVLCLKTRVPILHQPWADGFCQSARTPS